MESVALTYAKALFSLSIEEGNSNEILDETKFIYDVITSNKELIKILDSKSIEKEDKKEIIVKIFGQEVNKVVLNFMKLLIDKSRIHNLDQICLEYRKAYLEYNNIKEAKIYSATKLSDLKMEELKLGLQQKYNSDFIVENIIDEKLVAGVKVVIGDLVLDGSVSNKLERMKSSITI